MHRTARFVFNDFRTFCRNTLVSIAKWCQRLNKILYGLATTLLLITMPSIIIILFSDFPVEYSNALIPLICPDDPKCKFEMFQNYSKVLIQEKILTRVGYLAIKPLDMSVYKYGEPLCENMVTWSVYENGKTYVYEEGVMTCIFDAETQKLSQYKKVAKTWFIFKNHEKICIYSASTKKCYVQSIDLFIRENETSANCKSKKTIYAYNNWTDISFDDQNYHASNFIDNSFPRLRTKIEEEKSNRIRNHELIMVYFLVTEIICLGGISAEIGYRKKHNKTFPSYVHIALFIVNLALVAIGHYVASNIVKEQYYGIEYDEYALEQSDFMIRIFLKHGASFWLYVDYILSFSFAIPGLIYSTSCVCIWLCAYSEHVMRKIRESEKI